MICQVSYLNIERRQLNPGWASYLIWRGLVIVGLLRVWRRHLQMVVLVVVRHQLHPILRLERKKNKRHQLFLHICTLCAKRNLDTKKPKVDSKK